MSQPGEGSCPICGKPRDLNMRPFCSKRCADIDLGRWLRGEYTIPGAPLEDNDQAAGPEDDGELN